MRFIMFILMLMVVAPALSAGKPTPEECKRDPMRAGCEKK